MDQTACEVGIAQTVSGQLEKQGGKGIRNPIFGYRYQFGLIAKN
jgi:hypothetical protein